jgi:S1-C subfamily serine protease
MRVELRILTGARTGEREVFEKPVVSIGRHPTSDLRFDASADLDVSARHVELRIADGRMFLRDLGSTNGTFVNGVRADGERPLRDGDEISFGAVGPRVIVRSVAASPGGAPSSPSAAGPTRARGDTEVRIARAVDVRTAGLRRTLAAAVVLLALGVGGAYALGRRGAGGREARIEALLLRNDSLAAAQAADLRRLLGRVAGLDSALAATEAERVRLRRRLQAERAGAGEEGLDALGRQLALNERRHAGLGEAVRLDYASIAARGTPAVALIVVEMDDTTRWTGSAFAVGGGRLVTNRHLVADARGRRPRRIAAIFSDTRTWRPARLLRVDAHDDLALLALDGAPAARAAMLVPAPASSVGAPVAILGYPLGLDTPMGGSGAGMTAKATLGVGVVAKATADVLQIDAFAGEGSSGSPVLGADGRVVGVVFGGARESGGRIVYAVPGDRLARFVADALGGGEQ